MADNNSTFQDFTSFFEPIRVAYNGKEYTLPLVSAKLGSYLKLISEQASKVVQTVEENEERLKNAKEGEEPELKELPELEVKLPKEYKGKETHELMLGDELLDEMYEDGAPYTFMVHAGMTLYYDFVFGRSTALAYWNSGGDPKAVSRSLPGANSFTKNTDEETTTQ